MYFNKDKEDTNIDHEFKKQKKTKSSKEDKEEKEFEFDFNRWKMPIIIGSVILLIIIILIIILSSRGKTQYYLNLKGDSEITIKIKSDYTDPGYEAYDSRGNDLKQEVTINGTVDNNTIGIYTVTYSLDEITKTRTVSVIKTINTIYVIGPTSIRINVGTPYEDQGCTAVNAYTGDVTDQVKVTNNVDINKKGAYKITYSITDPDGEEIIEERSVIVE